MDYETALTLAEEQTSHITTVIEDNFLIIAGKDFKIRHASGSPKSCMIWCRPSETSGYRCVGSASLGRCKNFDSVREKISEKIAVALVRMSKENGGGTA